METPCISTLGKRQRLSYFGIIFILNPGYIWVATDTNKDGVAEEVSLFSSLGKYKSETTRPKA